MDSAAPPRTPLAGKPAPALRLLGAAASVAVLGLLLWGVATQRDYATLPTDVAWDGLHYPIAVGAHAARSEPELRQLLLGTRPGVEVELGAPWGRRALVPEVQGAHLWLTLLNALLFWAVATFALAPRLARGAVRDLFACFLFTALAVAISGPPAPREGLGFLLPTTYLASLSLMPSLFWRFSLAFPRAMPLLVRHAPLVRWVPLLGVGIAAWNVQAQLAWFADPSPERFDALAIPMALLEAHLVLGMLAGIVVLYRNGRGAELAREKRQAKWILWGIAIGATPFVFLRILSRLLFDVPDTVDPAVDRIVEMTIPVAITIAVVRERFLDIDVIIRRSLIYTALALGAAGIAFLTLLLAGRWADLPEVHVWVLAVAIPAALFFPARRLVSRWVDRTFFRIRHGYARALADLKRSLAPAASQAEVGRTLCAFLREALHPKALAVVVRDGGDWTACGDLEAARARAAVERLAPLGPEFGVLLARRAATAVPELERDDVDPALVAADMRLAQPIARDGRLLGLLLLGERATERRYVEEDLRVLAAAAQHAAEILERLELVQRVAQESLARRGLAELARQKADFFARVAHDLRTPLTAIRWSVRNLQEGLAGPVSERQADYLGSVDAAAGQLGRLVDNLVDLGRLDLGAPERPPEPVDLGAVVQDAVRALRPLADAAHAHFEVRIAPELPRAHGRPEAAYQIVVNLLDNAIKYTREDTAIEVEAARDGPDHVRLTVRDHGPGLPVADRARIFELFQRGPESPRGPTKGFGIGLHVVRAWTDAFGGQVTVDDHPEGGARFTCRLPAWRPEAKEEA